jgi:hypothetical protein
LHITRLSPREVDRKIVGLVARAREEHGIPEGCGGEKACGRLGFELGRAPLPPGTAGMISGDRVVVDRNIGWAPRAEFTIYHEITHHLIEEDGEIIEHFTELFRSDDGAFKQEIERCCDKGAAEFLMPRKRVAETIKAETFSVELVGAIAERHGASLIASAIQLAHCAPVECYVVLCSYGPVPRSRPLRRGLYVDYVGASPSRRYPLARFSPVHSDHTLSRAWEERERVEDATSYVPFRSAFRSHKRMPCHCEAERLGPFVAGILSFEEAAPQGQVSFDL